MINSINLKTYDKLQISMEIIAFHVNHFSLRGSEVAIFDYARYNEELLGNKSMIFVQNNFRDKIDYRGIKVHNNKIYDKFNHRFKIIEYSSFDNIQSLCNQHKVTLFYNLKSGEKDNQVVPNIKNANHCVFTYNKQNAHGDIYIPISPSIVESSIKNITPHVPHIINFSVVDGHLRDFLKIPNDAIVFGRHGGEETFNIPFVHKAVQQIAEENENIYFLFLNTQLFCNPRKNIIFIQGLTEHNDKSRFINSCDAMLHARKEGESFGIAIAEFSVSKKPIITWKNDGKSGIKIDVEHTHHIDVLGDKGIYYSDELELKTILCNFSKIELSEAESLDCYSRLYSPQIVMDLFEKYIINHRQSIYNYISNVDYQGSKYTHFDNDDVSKSLYKNGWEPHVYSTIALLLNPGEIFVDVGSNIGYHTVKTASMFPDSNIISIEPQTDLFNMLEYNVHSNNLKNVLCLNIGASSRERIKYIPQLSFDTKNMGDITITDIKNSNSDEVTCIDIDYLLKDHQNVKIIKMDVSGNELDVLKGSIELLINQRPYLIIPLESHTCRNNGYTCRSIKNLLYSLKYTMIEINSDYPCDHLCYPNEKQNEVDKIFGSLIADNTNHNSVNDNISLGITKTIHHNMIHNTINRESVKQPSTQIQQLLKEFEESNEKEIQHNTRIKLLCNWTSSEELCKCWSKMSQRNCTWNNLQITHEDNNIDYHVIINKPQPNSKYIVNKTIVFRMEPDTETSSHWNDWYNSKDDFMYFLDLSKFRNNSEWHLGLWYDEIKMDMNDQIEECELKKTKVLSTVLSSLYQMEGHRKRIDFVKYLQTNNVDIDVYGRDNLFGLQNHKGELPYHNKAAGILPYKYTFIAENCSMNNYFTEKLLDPILGDTVCFYWGCPNVDRFIDNRAYIKLDLNNFEESMKIVKQSIDNDEWSKRIPIIKKEQKKIIEHYSFFPRIEGLIAISNLPCYVVNLDRRQNRWNDFQSAAKNVGFKRYSRFSAVDGNKLKAKDTINMFRNFPRRIKRGEAGCAITHYNIWHNVIQDTMILEDDGIPEENFVDSLAMIYRYIKSINLDFDVLYIGYHLNKDVMREKNITEDDLLNDRNDMIVSMIDVMKYKTNDNVFGYHGGGTFGYIISPQGAKKLVESIDKEGFLWPVDYHMLLKSLSNIKSYCLIDRIVKSDMYEPNSKQEVVDTDIQNSEYLF